jgi:hypothetical protein
MNRHRQVRRLFKHHTAVQLRNDAWRTIECGNDPELFRRLLSKSGCQGKTLIFKKQYQPVSLQSTIGRGGKSVFTTALSAKRKKRRRGYHYQCKKIRQKKWIFSKAYPLHKLTYRKVSRWGSDWPPVFGSPIDHSLPLSV